MVWMNSARVIAPSGTAGVLLLAGPLLFVGLFLAGGLLSLVLLRMTFPVDVLSYALGLFSQRTSALDNALSTGLGAAPFALLFALVPSLSSRTQGAVLVVSSLVFVLYAAWMLRRSAPQADA